MKASVIMLFLVLVVIALIEIPRIEVTDEVTITVHSKGFKSQDNRVSYWYVKAIEYDYDIRLHRGHYEKVEPSNKYKAKAMRNYWTKKINWISEVEHVPN
jgi:hypothetical protein